MLEVISDASRKFALNEQQIYERQGYLKEWKNEPIALGIKTFYAGSLVSGLCLRASQYVAAFLLLMLTSIKPNLPVRLLLGEDTVLDTALKLSNSPA